MSTTATQVLAKQSLGNKVVRRGLLYVQDLKTARLYEARDEGWDAYQESQGLRSLWCQCPGPASRACESCGTSRAASQASIAPWMGGAMHAQTTHRIQSPYCRTFSDAIKPTPSINWVRPHVAKGHVAANHLHFVLMQPGAWATLTENKMGCGIILSMS